MVPVVRPGDPGVQVMLAVVDLPATPPGRRSAPWCCAVVPADPVEHVHARGDVDRPPEPVVGAVPGGGDRPRPEPADELQPGERPRSTLICHCQPPGPASPPSVPVAQFATIPEASAPATAASRSPAAVPSRRVNSTDGLNRRDAAVGHPAAAGCPGSPWRCTPGRAAGTGGVRGLPPPPSRSAPDRVMPPCGGELTPYPLIPTRSNAVWSSACSDVRGGARRPRSCP